jgi:hypothetical protein
MIIKRGSRDTRGCLPVNESIKKTCHLSGRLCQSEERQDAGGAQGRDQLGCFCEKLQGLNDKYLN